MCPTASRWMSKSHCSISAQISPSHSDRLSSPAPASIMTLDIHVVPTQLCLRAPECWSRSCKVRLHGEKEGEGEGEPGEPEMRWDGSSLIRRRVIAGLAFLLRSGRTLIPWIYTQTMAAVQYIRICDRTREIHILLLCLQACAQRWILI